jgi:8-oxo-dGTP pyrophosphatase MutT (NUDIX family)
MGAIEERIAERYVPLWIGGAIRGRVRRDLLDLLRGMPEIADAPVGLALRDLGLAGPGRNRLLQRLARRLRAAGVVADWRDEQSSILDEQGREVARCERGVFRTLGIRNRAVHVNGFLPDGRIWVARRSQRKRSDPGMLDNIAAGGVGAGETLRRCAARELWEEAGVPAWRARRVHFPGMAILSLREVRFGLHDEQVVVADLELSSRFEPIGRDGEVAEFLCLERADVLRRLDAGEFTIEAALAMRDFLQRRI